MIGTQLVTISEKKSVATLQTIPSNLTFQKRIASLQQPASTYTLRKETNHGLRRRRQCISLDEQAILEHHRKDKASSEQSPRRPVNDSLGPVEPPFSPPERVKTPEGIPSWRGQVRTMTGSQTNTNTPGTSILFQQLRARSSQVLRQLFGTAATRPTQTRIWRPPVSGHRTQTFGRLDTHPFVTAPVGRVEGSDGTAEGQSVNGSQKDTAENNGQRIRSATLGSPHIAPFHSPFGQYNPASQPDPSATQVRVTSPSQRALHAASGIAVPVTPERAQKRTNAANNARTVSIPGTRLSQMDRLSPVERQPTTAPSGTINTIQLIEQFPQPPNSPNRRDEPGERANLNLLSLFPTNQEHVQSRNQIMASVHDKEQKARKRPRSNAIVRKPVNFSFSRAQNRSMNGTEAEISVSAADNISDEHTATRSNEPSIRGESASRYRESGTPVYDNDATSLRSFDAQRAQIAKRRFSNNVLSLPRPDSVMTGDTRYFSAASTSLGTRVMSQRFASNDEQERAVENGTLSLAPNGDATVNVNPAESMSSPSAATQQDENAFPITPVTVTNASKTYCRHRMKQLHQSQRHGANRIDLDGTSPAPIQDPSPSQEVEPNSNNRTTTLHFQPSVESFMQRHHISRKAKTSTWGTRMRKTKCWRCELEARRTASSEALYKRYRNLVSGWPERWNRIKENLRWTCFCRYQAYDEDPDDEAEVRERARLGRFGGSLSDQRRY